MGRGGEGHENVFPPLTFGCFCCRRFVRVVCPLLRLLLHVQRSAQHELRGRSSLTWTTYLPLERPALLFEETSHARVRLLFFPFPGPGCFGSKLIIHCRSAFWIRFVCALHRLQGRRGLGKIRQLHRGANAGENTMQTGCSTHSPPCWADDVARYLGC